MSRSLKSTGERVYRAIKRQILAGDFLPGERIDAPQLADEHAASLTPVRAALHRLVGEQLVIANPNEGFHAPSVTEPGLHDLYVWNAQVLQLALRMGGRVISDRFFPTPLEAGSEPIVFISRIFRGLALASGNACCVAEVEALNDRLSLPRQAEERLFQDLAGEAEAVAAALIGDQSGAASKALADYHRRRLQHAAQIVRQIHRR